MALGISANRQELLMIADAVAREKSIEREIVIAASRFIAALIRARHGVPETRLRVIWRGIDPAVFDPDAVGPDRLARLTRVIAESGASVKDIEHDRAFSGPDVSAVHVVCTVETRDRAHIAALQRALKKNGFPLVVAK